MKSTYIFLSLVLVAMLCIPVMAAPTTGAATLIGSNNVTVTMIGAVAPCWFIWGQQDAVKTWRTPNTTPTGGESTYRIKGSPLLGNTLFYYQACDITGCGATLTFTTGVVTPIPTTTYGATFDNLTENGMDLTLVGVQSTVPYMWLIPGYEALIWGIMFAFIFLGLWLRGRDITAPTILGLMIGSFIFFGDKGLSLGIPIELVNISQGIIYASLAGIILSIIKK